MRRFRRMLAAAACAALVGGAAAADVSYEFTVCTHGKPVMLEANADFVGYAVEGWGVVATSNNPAWENASTHCLGTMRAIGGKKVGSGLCKWVQAGGDMAIGEWSLPESGEPTWRWLTGTGKLKGIQGRGTFRDIFTARTVDTGTSQGCRRDWGSYALPD